MTWTLTQDAYHKGQDIFCILSLIQPANSSSCISPEMAVRLEAVIGGTADHWLRMQAAYDLAQVRLKNADMTNGAKAGHASGIGIV